MRHAEATYFEIRVTYEHGLLTIEVEDNGVGFDPRKITPGRGLVTMRKRATEFLSGTFELQSSEGQGTVVRLAVNIV